MSARSSRRLRSVTFSLLAVPRTKTNYRDRSFAVYGPRVWNSLHDELRSPDITLTTFRNKLKTLLFNVWLFFLAYLWHLAKVLFINALNNNNHNWSRPRMSAAFPSFPYATVVDCLQRSSFVILSHNPKTAVNGSDFGFQKFYYTWRYCDVSEGNGKNKLEAILLRCHSRKSWTLIFARLPHFVLQDWWKWN